MDNYGVSQYSNGSYYFVSTEGKTVNLSYYNPVNGDYSPVGDNNVYDSNGNPTGQTVNGATTGAALAGSASSHANWLDILNSAVGAAGDIFGNNNNNNNTTQTVPPYTAQPIVTPAKTGTGWKIAAVVGILGVVVILVVKSGKKSSAAK